LSPLARHTVDSEDHWSLVRNEHPTRAAVLARKTPLRMSRGAAQS
jgi:hypothetical protein